MTIANPLADNAPTDPEDRALVPRARSGERQAGRRGRDAGDPPQGTDPALIVRGAEQLPHLALPHRLQSPTEHEARTNGAEGSELSLLR
jgi:hypothetical protein